MKKYKVSSSEEVINLLVSKFGSYKTSNISIDMIDDINDYISNDRLVTHYLQFDNDTVQIISYVSMIYGTISFDLDNQITYHDKVKLSEVNKYDESIYPNTNHEDYLVVESKNYLYELHGYKILDNDCIEFDIAKKKPKTTSNADLDNLIILVYYVCIANLNREAAYEAIANVKHLLLNEPNIKEIIVPIHNRDSAVECIYPKMPDEKVMDYLNELNNKINNLINSK